MPDHTATRETPLKHTVKRDDGSRQETRHPPRVPRCQSRFDYFPKFCRFGSHLALQYQPSPLWTTLHLAPRTWLCVPALSRIDMVFGDFSPELRLHIAFFLDKSDAVSLAGAHSTWQDAAESVIWRNADMADVDVPDLWWTDDQLHKLDTHLRKSWVRLYDAIFSRPIRATMIRRLAFVPLNDTAGLALWQSSSYGAARPTLEA